MLQLDRVRRTCNKTITSACSNFIIQLPRKTHTSQCHQAATSSSKPKTTSSFYHSPSTILLDQATMIIKTKDLHTTEIMWCIVEFIVYSIMMPSRQWSLVHIIYLDKKNFSSATTVWRKQQEIQCTFNNHHQHPNNVFRFSHQPVWEIFLGPSQ